MYKIIDWAGNEMKEQCQDFGFWMPLEFNSFDEAESWLVDVLDKDYENERGEYYIVKENKK